MKAIQTRYFGPTNTKPSRIKVWAEGVPAMFFSYDHAENDGGRFNAALALARKYHWQGALVEGALPNGDSVYCFTASESRAI